MHHKPLRIWRVAHSLWALGWATVLLFGVLYLASPLHIVALLLVTCILQALGSKVFTFKQTQLQNANARLGRDHAAVFAASEEEDRRTFADDFAIYTFFLVLIGVGVMVKHPLHISPQRVIGFALIAWGVLLGLSWWSERSRQQFSRKMSKLLDKS